MKLARVQDKKDLIYKKGSGEVKKAKVTIRFCNKNKDKSPIGLEKYDEVIIERSLSAQDEKNKFTVNGKIKKNNEIKEMFKQIRLNVDVLPV